jgi:hypothetical protein
MAGIRVLITNNALVDRAGSELYVRDLATALLERGHSPVVFSTVLGDVAQELRAATVPVIDDLRALGVSPDIIHGQHHVETMMALLRFPDTPAVQYCHGWVPWEEAPIRFPRILRYVAVDNTCRDRLVFENGIPENRIKVLLNFVDLRRFKPRGPLPSRPQRALLFSNNAREQISAKVREACEHSGIGLDVMGADSGNVCREPEAVLRNYDLVFAKARAALEAMAVGTAVILCDAAGVGSMVTTENLDLLRPLNFGIRALNKPIESPVLAREIARYDAVDATRVHDRIRAIAGREPVVDELLSLYSEVVDEFKSTTRNLVEEEQSVSKYLGWLSPRLKEIDSLRKALHASNSFLVEERTELLRTTAQLANSNKELSDTKAELASVTDTLGWRLLKRYGPIKHGLVLPAFRSLQKLLPRKEH